MRSSRSWSIQRETAKRLLDARNACREVGQFTTGRTQDTILTDRGLQLILQTLLVTIGEALGHVRRTDPDIAHAIPDLHRIIGMRNQIVHGYDSVDYPIVWKVATSDIPGLAGVLDRLLAAAPPPTSDHEPLTAHDR